MADSREWFNRLNNASAQVLEAIYSVLQSVDQYLGDTAIVADYFLRPSAERRTDVVEADVVAAGRILNELKAWLDALDGATGVTRKSRLFKLKGPSL